MMRGTTREGSKVSRRHGSGIRNLRDKKKELKNKKQELSRIKDALHATKDSTERGKHKNREKRVRAELFQIRMDLRAARERKAEGNLEGASSALVPGETERGALPNFIIIGGQKCGTTSLYRLLVQHPQVEGGALKEIHYFDNRFDKGIDWYRRQFPEPRWMNGHKTITGEATPAYLFLPYIPERVKEAAPEVRLIAILRNPVNRAYSHYHQKLRLGVETRSFEEAVGAEEARLRDRHDIMPGFEYAADSGRRLSSYLARGIYVDQLVRWSKLFDDEQLLVLKSEDFFGRREETVRRILGFLGLPEWTEPSGEVRNRGRSKSGYAPMEPTTRRRLEEFFEPHNQRLYEYLGVDYNW